MSHPFRLGSFLVSLLVGVPLLSSCGGGGNGVAVPTSTPTPGSLAAPLSCPANSFSPNYISTNAGISGDSSTTGFTYWRHFPVTVYIPATDDATHAAIVAGFNEWVASTSGKASYTLVSNPTGANISVSIEPLASNSNTLGLTTVNYIENANTIVSATMQLFFNNPDGSVNTPNNLNGYNQSIAAHEFGHALGIGPHSLDGSDLMYYAIHADAGAEAVTTRDHNTLATIYCNNFSTAEALSLPSTGRILTRTFQ